MNQVLLALDKPWAAVDEVRRFLSLPFIWATFAFYGIRWGKRWAILGMPMIQKYRRSQIIIGDAVQMRSWRSTNPLSPNHPVVLATRSPDAVIRIGNDVGLTGTTLVAAECIEIGSRVYIGANSTIVDTDFHPLDPYHRSIDGSAGLHRAVCIEDDVFIGLNSIILKGVRIGSGAVIGAGSVVATDVPAGMIAAGNPARVIRPVTNS